MATLQDLRDMFYNILREEQDSRAYPLEMTDLLLNAAQQRICLGRVVNPLTKEEVKKGTLPFLNADQFYTTVQSTSTTADLTTSSTTINVNSASNFEASGSLYLDGDIVSYTGKTATSFTGVSWVSFAHLSWTSVYPAYSLPADFGSVINIVYDHKYQLENQLYDDVFENLRSKKGSDYRRNTARWPFSEPYLRQPFYTIKDNSYLLLYNINASGYAVMMRYEKMPTTMSTGSAEATISNDLYAKTTIPYLAVGEMLYNRGEEARAGEIFNFAIWQIREMYSYYNNSVSEKMSGKQYKIAKWNINI